VVSDATDQYDAPQDNERFDAVRERVRLEGPSHV